MSYSITTAQVQQYTTNIQMLLQQAGSRLRGSVMEQQCFGKAATAVEQFGQTNPVFNQARHSDTPIMDVPQDRRWLYPTDADWATLTDDQDKLRLIIDPNGPLTSAGQMAMGRAMDDILLSGFFGVNQTGENGTTATATLYAYNSNSQSVAATVGASAATGLNVAKLRAAKRKLLEAEVDVDNDPLFIGITAKQHDDLLGEVQAINLDYTDRPALVDGKISRFMGFNFIHTERIPGGGSFNSSAAFNSGITSADSDGQYVASSRWLVPCWAKSGMTLGIWNEIQATIDRRADKRNAWQVYVTMTLGATRNEEKRCVLINCK